MKLPAEGTPLSADWFVEPAGIDGGSAEVAASECKVESVSLCGPVCEAGAPCGTATFAATAGEQG